MAKFLTTNGISSEIEKIIIEAKSKLILISPFLQLSKTLYERLKDTADNGITIEIIYGKDELKPNEKESLSTLKNVKLYFFENLHAKCYFNENKMVITSMNMYEFSEKNNREMGVLIEKNNDTELYQNAYREAISILNSSEEILTNSSYQRRKSTPNRNSRKNDKSNRRGYCIRCEGRTMNNPYRPYCEDCFFVWAQFENVDYQENVCHNCGKFEPTSMNKPLCYSCYKEIETF